MRLQLLPNYSNSIKHLPNNDQEKREIDFMGILHLAEWYQDQYRERGLCLSEAQNEASFRDSSWLPESPLLCSRFLQFVTTSF